VGHEDRSDGLEIYLPIADMSVSWPIVLGLGTTAGFIAGLLGVGGGFLMTPLLIFYGIPSGIVVATQASPISASALVGAVTRSASGSVDFKMGFILLCGGLAGSAVGVDIFDYLRRLGQIDFVVSIGYALLLSSVGGLMLVESAQTYFAIKKGAPPSARLSGQHTWIHRLPFKTRFRASRLYVSAIPVVVLGFSVGMMTAILGTGGGFLLIPAQIYLLRMRTAMAVGTSQFQVCIVAMMTTLIHAVTGRTVDIVLAFLLILGSVLGAQIGLRVASRLRGEQLRIAFALLLLAIAVQLIFGLTRTPRDIYTTLVGT
jgi:uncharacterized protein